MKDLTVFILTHNRPVLVQTAIESVLRQEPFDFKFVVSDNSDDDKTEQILKEKPYFDKINYYHTNANGADRWHDIFSRVETEYFMVFHDDDEMLPNMVETLYQEITEKQLLAVGGNAKVYVNGVFSKNYMNLKKNTVVREFDLFAERWNTGGMAPFPSYIYNKLCMTVFPFDFPAGKFSDSVFIGNIIKKLGPVGNACTPVFIYNIHSGQDSASYDYLSDYYLYRYFKNNSSINNVFLKKYKIKILYRLMKAEFKKTKKISKVKSKILFHNSIILYIRFHVIILSMLKN